MGHSDRHSWNWLRGPGGQIAAIDNNELNWEMRNLRLKPYPSDLPPSQISDSNRARVRHLVDVLTSRSDLVLDTLTQAQTHVLLQRAQILLALPATCEEALGLTP